MAATWNQISVDGDTSTNDTVFLVASGAASETPIDARHAGGRGAAAGVAAVARSLARQQASDGEGATTLITCTVTGAIDDFEARAVARSVVSSSLLKAAVHGRDPNWGRVLGAAGNAHLADAAVLEAAGLPTEATPARRRARWSWTSVPAHRRSAARSSLRASRSPSTRPRCSAAMDAPEVSIELDLGAGDGTGEAFGCDLTEAYVIENSEYST